PIWRFPDHRLEHDGRSPIEGMVETEPDRGHSVTGRGRLEDAPAAPPRLLVRVAIHRLQVAVVVVAHVVLLICSCRCAGSRLMTAFSCWWRVACSAAWLPDCPRRSVFIAHAYCSRRSSMLSPTMRTPSSLRG